MNNTPSSDLRTKHINEVLAKYPNAKARAVSNFISTVSFEDTPPYGGYGNAVANLRMDAASYKWNDSTVKAIHEALTGLKRDLNIK